MWLRLRSGDGVEEMRTVSETSRDSDLRKPKVNESNCFLEAKFDGVVGRKSWCSRAQLSNGGVHEVSDADALDDASGTIMLCYDLSGSCDSESTACFAVRRDSVVGKMAEG